ncbi:P-loop containing nucleoside triphosphate hydrolase protein, partial [Endogone sp. FLAS-F59071]
TDKYRNSCRTVTYDIHHWCWGNTIIALLLNTRIIVAILLNTRIMSETDIPPVPFFILMGTSGSGKSSVGEELAKLLRCEYIEGDYLHSEESIKKMASGHPLTDADREPWLKAIRAASISAATAVYNQPPSSPSRCVVVGCSALRRAYRDFLRSIPEHLACLTFVYLRGTLELLEKRLANRVNHFMKTKMLRSQFETLEEPNEAEGSVIVHGIEQNPEEIARDVLEKGRERGLVGKREE